MAAARQNERLLAVDLDRISCRHPDPIVVGPLGHRDGHATERLHEVFEAVEVDEGVVVDLDAEDIVHALDDAVVAAVFDGGVYLAVAVAVDVDTRVAGDGENTHLLVRLVHARNHDAVGAVVLVGVVARVAAQQQNVVRLDRADDLLGVGDLVVAAQCGEDAVVPQGRGGAHAGEQHHKRDGDAYEDALFLGGTAAGKRLLRIGRRTHALCVRMGAVARSIAAVVAGARKRRGTRIRARVRTGTRIRIGACVRVGARVGARAGSRARIMLRVRRTRRAGIAAMRPRSCIVTAAGIPPRGRRVAIPFTCRCPSRIRRVSTPGSGIPAVRAVSATMADIRIGIPGPRAALHVGALGGKALAPVRMR